MPVQRPGWSQAQTLGAEILHHSWAAQQLTAHPCPCKTAQGMAALKTRQQNLCSSNISPSEGKKTLFWLQKNQSNRQTLAKKKCNSTANKLTKTTHTKHHRNKNPKANPPQKPIGQKQKINPNDTCHITEILLFRPLRSISGDAPNCPSLRSPC